MKIFQQCLALVVMAALSACDAPSRSDSAAAEKSAVPVASTSTPVPGASQNTAESKACPHDGKWALCSIERRLRQAGFVMKRVVGDGTRRVGFSVVPTVYTLGKSRLEVFLYRDSAALARDIATIDTISVGPPGAPSQWGEVPPVLIRSANLAAVLLSQNPRQTERVMLALTAGAPQPGSPR